MISIETINNKIRMLPSSSQIEVLEFIDTLIEKTTTIGQAEKAQAWEKWAKSHSSNAAKVIDDSRETIYEDE
jgi:hypothetical protein